MTESYDLVIVGAGSAQVLQQPALLPSLELVLQSWKNTASVVIAPGQAVCPAKRCLKSPKWLMGYENISLLYTCSTWRKRMAWNHW